MFKEKPSCYELNTHVKKGDLLIANLTDYGLTEGRVYVADSDQGEDTFGDCFFVINDEGKRSDYSNEWFCLYGGELVSMLSI